VPDECELPLGLVFPQSLLEHHASKGCGQLAPTANCGLAETSASRQRKTPPSGFSPVAQRFLCATNWRTVSRPGAPLSLSNDELPNIIGKRGKECTAVWMWIRDTRRKFVHVAEVPSLLVETDLDWHVRFERVL